MRSSHSSFWIYAAVITLFLAPFATAAYDAYGNYIPDVPYPTTTINPMYSGSPTGYSSGMPMTSSNTMMSGQSADEMSLARDAQLIDQTLATISGGSTPTSTGSYYGSQTGISPVGTGYATTGTMYGSSGSYAGSPGYSAGTTTSYPMPSSPQMTGSTVNYGSSTSPATYLASQGFGSMNIQEANDLFVEIAGKGSISNADDTDFNDSSQRLEEAFNRCNFADTKSVSDPSVTPSAVAIRAVNAIKVIINNITSGWDKVQKEIADIALTELDATERTSNQNRWKTAAYMLAAAANNKSFRSELATQTLKASAPQFWLAVGKVFSIQPVSRRVKDSTGVWREVEEERRIIEALFRATQLLTSAKDSVGVIEKDEQTNFVLGTRMFTSIIIQPAFAFGSIGLHVFAFRIFNEGIMKWLKDLGIVTAKRDELWIIAAEAFNIMYSGSISPSMAPAKKIITNRANGFGTDHIAYDFGKGSMALSLKNTYLAAYAKSLRSLADIFTKRHSAVGGLANMIAKSQSDLMVLMLCAEACEYSMNETQAPDGPNLITFFYEKGFTFNNSVVNWNELTPGAACLTIITLDRLHQRTATSRLSTVLGFDKSRSSIFGDYTSTSIYEALQLCYETILEATTKFPLVGTKLRQLLPKLRSNKTELNNYMSNKTELKGLRARPRAFTPPQVTGSTAAYSSMNTALQSTTFNMGAIPQASVARTGFPPTATYRAPYSAGYGAPASAPAYGTTGSYRPAPAAYGTQMRTATPAYGMPMRTTAPAYGTSSYGAPRYGQPQYPTTPRAY